MRETEVEDVYITERVNGWWVSVRYGSGHEEHHGPYLDEEIARNEAAQFSAEAQRRTDDGPSSGA